LCHRKEHAKHRALAARAVHGDLAAVVADDAVGDRQAEPRSLAHRLGREEGLEDAREIGRLDAFPGVGELENDVGAGIARADRDRALAADGLRGVHQEVHEHLAQLRGAAFNERQSPVFLAHLRLVFDLVVDDVERGVDRSVDVGGLPPLVARRTRIALQVADDLGHARDAVTRLRHQRAHVVLDEVEVGGLARGLDVRAQRRVGDRSLGLLIGGDQREDVGDVAVERCHVRLYEADGVVDLVRHARRELPDRRELLRLQELVLRALQLAIRRCELLVAPLERARRGLLQPACARVELALERRRPRCRRGGRLRETPRAKRRHDERHRQGGHHGHQEQFHRRHAASATCT